MDTIGKEALWQRWLERRSRLSEAQERVRREAFRLIRDGQAATEATLQARTGLAPDVFCAALTALHTQGLIVQQTSQGDIVGVFGLSLVPTPHALCLDGRQLFTWCALDAVGIPVGLASDATVRSHCFACQQELTLVYTAGDLRSVSMPDLRLWITVPDVQGSAVADT